MASGGATLRDRRCLFFGCLAISLAALVSTPALAACGSFTSQPKASPVDVEFDAPMDKIVGGVRLSDPTVSWDGSGRAVDIFGDVLAVGAAERGQENQGPGMVHVYRNLGGAWSEEAQLTPDDREVFNNQVQLSEGLRFGGAVAVGERVVAVGAPGIVEALSAGYAGAVYVFDYEGQSWVKAAKLTPDSSDRPAPQKEPAWLQATGLSHRAFGALVALKGDALAVSGDSAAGSVYVFRRGASGWQKQARLQIAPRPGKDLYLASLALYGDTLAVSALYVLPQAGPASGVLTGTPVVYVFERAGDTWQETFQFAPDGEAGVDLFGIDENIGAHVALTGSAGRAGRLAVGLPGFPDLSKAKNLERLLGAGSQAKFPESKRQAGAVYLFERDAKGGWSQLATLRPAGWDNPPGPSRVDLFQVSTGATPAPPTPGLPADEPGGAAPQSTPATPAPPTEGSPAASTLPTPAAIALVPISVFRGDVISDNPAVTFFGSTVDLDGNRLAVTSGYANASYVFEGGGRNWTYRFSLIPGWKGNSVWEDYAQVVRLSGDTALLGTPGEFGSSAYVFDLCVPSSGNCK